MKFILEGGYNRFLNETKHLRAYMKKADKKIAQWWMEARSLGLEDKLEALEDILSQVRFKECLKEEIMQKANVFGVTHYEDPPPIKFPPEKEEVLDIIRRLRELEKTTKDKRVRVISKIAHNCLKLAFNSQDPTKSVLQALAML